MGKNPFVSIIIVNFNGRHLLHDCLTSLRNQAYPKKDFEVIVVDNNSSDDSVPFVLHNFPEVILVKSEENVGFTGGNQKGLDVAKGEYIVLLNSDVTTDRHWLNALVEEAKDKSVGMVSSRLRYAIPCIELSIHSKAIPKSQIYPGIDHSPVGVLIEDVICENDQLTNLVWYKQGFYDKTVGEVTTRRTNGSATVLLPFDEKQDLHTYKITLHGLETNEELTIPVRCSIGGKTYIETQVKPYEVKQLDLVIQKHEIKKYYVWLIQNAGNVVLHNGYGKDRGSYLLMKDNEIREGYEEESEYFLKPTELLSVCGASCLIKRKVIDHVGFLDGHYFMYYEDMELSLRAWRAGWKIKYAPKSLGYHRHRATTGNGESAFFLEHVERNHLAVVLTHFPLLTVFAELFLFFIRFGVTTLKSFVFQFKDEYRAQTWHIKYLGRKLALIFIIKHFFRIVSSRVSMSKYWPMNEKSLLEKTY